METHKRAELLLEKIGIICAAIKICILELKMKDIIVLQKHVMALYHFLHDYIDGWDVLNKSLNTEGYIVFEMFIGSSEYKNLKSEECVENENVDQECAFAQFMNVIENMDYNGM